jgi:predicted ATP-dependent endonuclease of OLD family
MIFSKFIIGYFRSFQDPQVLKLAKPVPGKLGSGITFVVGENNSGKTTVIEGLFMNPEVKIKSSEMNSSGSPLFELYDEAGSLVRKLKLIREGSYTLQEDPILQRDQCFEIVPSRRHWDSTADSIDSVQSVLMSTVTQRPRSNRSQTAVSAALKAIERNPSQYLAFVNFVKEVLPDFSSYAIGYEDHEYIEYKNNEGIKHKSDYLGDGVISILRIMVHLFEESSRPLIIDEPELSLHPLAQKRLFKMIAKRAQNRQIIVATHSPYFVSWECIKNGATLNKVSKHGDVKSQIFTLKDFSEYERLISGANWQQPFLMDIVSKEIFFHDDILFVEGQEDVGLLKSDGDISDEVNLFGYGVRGSGAFKFALKLAKDLGTRRASVILDAGATENAIKRELERDYPDYKIIQWNKGDIRDKAATTTSVKNGYFTTAGVKKSASELDDYDMKIAAINAYFGI